MNRNKFWNIVWGLLFIAAAGLIILQILGMLGTLSFWTLAVSIPIAAGVIACAVKRIWFGMFVLLVPLAFIFKDYIEEATGLALSFWPMIGVAVLLSIGFHLLFGGGSKWHKKDWDKDWNKNWASGQYTHDGKPSIEDATGEKVYFSERFTGACKYIKSENLSYVRVDNSFGGMEVYFENATLSPQGAVVDVNNSFGGVELYIPHGWNVINHVNNFAGATETPRREPAEGAPTITLRGTNNFGGIDVSYV